MTKRTSVVGISIVIQLLTAGCWGTRVATRQITIVENIGTDSSARAPDGGSYLPIEVDVSQLPVGSVKSRTEKDGQRWRPDSELRIFANWPYKVVLVPTTQVVRTSQIMEDKWGKRTRLVRTLGEDGKVVERWEPVDSR
jgi:hypothetical protein